MPRKPVYVAINGILVQYLENADASPQAIAQAQRLAKR
jgi:hypothetical protein